MSLITKSVEISTEFVGKPEGLLGKNADAETPESDPEHTVRCVQRGGLRLLLGGSFGGEGAQCITRPGGGGQEQEVRSEEHSGWSLAASVFIVSLDTTLKPEDSSKNRALNLMRSGKLEAAGGYQFLRKVTMNLPYVMLLCCSSHLSTEQFTSMFPNVSTCVSLLLNFPGDSQQQLCFSLTSLHLPAEISMKRNVLS